MSSHKVVSCGGRGGSGGDDIPLWPGYFVYLPTDVRRQMVAGDEGLTWIGIGLAVEESDGA